MCEDGSEHQFWDSSECGSSMPACLAVDSKYVDVSLKGYLGQWYCMLSNIILFVAQPNKVARRYSY